MKPSDIEYIVVHAADTRPSMDLGVKEIREWHVFPKTFGDGGRRYLGQMYKSVNDLPVEVKNNRGRGWSDIGYHFVIRRDGTIETGRPLDVPGAHVRGFNGVSWGICMAGGMAEDGSNDCNFTKRQYFSLDILITELLDKAPQAIAQGHRDFNGVTKTCPNFNVKEFYYG